VSLSSVRGTLTLNGLPRGGLSKLHTREAVRGKTVESKFVRDNRRGSRLLSVRALCDVHMKEVVHLQNIWKIGP
jgi:hypothetical protein